MLALLLGGVVFGTIVFLHKTPPRPGTPPSAAPGSAIVAGNSQAQGTTQTPSGQYQNLGPLVPVGQAAPGDPASSSPTSPADEGIELDQSTGSDTGGDTSTGNPIVSFNDGLGTQLAGGDNGSIGGPGTTAGAGDGSSPTPDSQPAVDLDGFDLMDAVHGDSSGMTDADVASTYANMAGPTGILF